MRECKPMGFVVFKSGFLCSPGNPGTYSVDQASLKLRDSPASASQVLGLKVHTITAQLPMSFSVLLRNMRAGPSKETSEV